MTTFCSRLRSLPGLALGTFRAYRERGWSRRSSALLVARISAGYLRGLRRHP